jgi:hypothetical protein
MTVKQGGLTTFGLDGGPGLGDSSAGAGGAARLLAVSSWLSPSARFEGCRRGAGRWDDSTAGEGREVALGIREGDDPPAGRREVSIAGETRREREGRRDEEPLGLGRISGGSRVIVTSSLSSPESGSATIGRRPKVLGGADGMVMVPTGRAPAAAPPTASGLWAMVKLPLRL